jgi:hypothetical protein
MAADLDGYYNDNDLIIYSVIIDGMEINHYNLFVDTCDTNHDGYVDIAEI